MTDTGRTRARAEAWFERVALAAAGGTLAVFGLRRRTLGGYGAALAGGWLAYRGLKSLRKADREPVHMEELEASAQGLELQRTITVQASPDEVWAFLEEPANLDAVFGADGSVEALGPDRQRWELATPSAPDLVWEMRREDDGAGQLGWTSTGEADVEVLLGMQPAAETGGTELSLKVGFEPSGGPVGQAWLQHFDIVPHAIVGRSLRRAKSLVETGEVPGLEANPSTGPPPLAEA
jgi:uncharacterized membrane protein